MKNLGASLLKIFNKESLGEGVSEVGGGESEEEGGDGVEDEGGVVVGGEEEDVFVGEGGECGEAAAEAGGEQQFGFFGHGYVAAYQPVDKADDEAADDVDGECAPWKFSQRSGQRPACGERAYPSRQQVAADASQAAADEYGYQGACHHTAGRECPLSFR